jgi:Zn-dependent protease with chaperone function
VKTILVTMFWLLCVCAAGGLLTWATNWLALMPWRRAKDAHWTERARLLFPVRASASWNLYLITANLVLASSLISWEDSPPWWTTALAAWLGVVAASRFLARETVPRLTFRDWLREVAVGWLFYFANWFILLAAIAIVPAEYHWSAWLVAAWVAALQAFNVWYGSIWLSKKLGLLKPAPEHLRHLVAQVAARTHIKVKRVWTFRSSVANAFALPHSGDVAFTDRALALLLDDEIAAVCAHELGHLSETRWVCLGRYLASLAWLPWIFVRPVWSTFGAGGVICLGALTYLVRCLMGQQSRLLEAQADRTAHITENQDGAFARALSRLYEDNQTPAVLSPNRYSHPNLYDRLLDAGITPDYPRPLPAESSTWGRYFLTATLILLVVLTMQNLPAL